MLLPGFCWVGVSCKAQLRWRVHYGGLSASLCLFAIGCTFHTKQNLGDYYGLAVVLRVCRVGAKLAWAFYPQLILIFGTVHVSGPSASTWLSGAVTMIPLTGRASTHYKLTPFIRVPARHLPGRIKVLGWGVLKPALLDVWDSNGFWWTSALVSERLPECNAVE